MASARFTAGRALPGALPPARAPRRQCATHRLPRALPDASQLVAVLTDASHTIAVAGTSPTVTNAAQRLSDVDPNTDVTPVVGGLAAGVSLVGGALYTAANGRLSAKSVSPARAMAILEKDPDAQLLDVRPRGDSIGGSPDLKSANKTSLACPYKPPSVPEGDQNSTVSVGWAERVGRMNKITDKNTIILLDSDGETAQQAAKALAKVFPKRKQLVTVAGGAAAWREQAAWKNAFGFSLPGFGPMPAARKPLTESANANTQPDSWRPSAATPAAENVAATVNESAASASRGVRRGAAELDAAVSEGSDSTKGALLIAAALGGGVLLFVELKQILELIGVIFVGQFLVRKVLFAEQRDATLAEVRSFVNDKVAAQDAGKDLRRLADAVLEVDTLGSVDDAGAQGLAQGAGRGAKKPVPAQTADADSARAWIDGWRESDDEGSVATEPVPARTADVESARAWISKWRASGRARKLVNA